jgi:hypothetical protein
VLRTVLVVAGSAGAALYFYADTLIEQRLRPATVELLKRRFDSEVELASVRVHVGLSLHVRGEGLVLRHQGRRDIPPLITIRAFTIVAGLRELWSRHIERVHLEGLEIVIPPRRRADMPTLAPAADVRRDQPDVHIEELLAEESLLTITSTRTRRGPRVFQLRRLRFEDLELSKRTPFEATLTNPTPEGEIAVVGGFGPWNTEEPRVTPIEGGFVFDADLATIKGIGGALHAEGTFKGPLDYIRTSGKTRTDGFYLSTGGETFPLLVDYEAIVDGTNGDTRLEMVEGRLGESLISARGDIVRVEGVNGRRITLETSTRGGRLEDFVKLTTRVQQSPLTGLVDANATVDIQPGPADVIERLELGGTFNVQRALFTSQVIQDRVDQLSRSGTGRPTDPSIENVASGLRGSFHLNDARMTLRSLNFRVQGAEVRLGGTYGVQSGRLDFGGTLRLQARASRTQTGWKSLVLRVFDPLLDGAGAGTVLPISITGTRDRPQFGADIKTAILK